MRSIRRTLRGSSVLTKTERNRVVLFRTRFTIWGSEIHMSKIRRRRPEPTPASVYSPVYNTSYRSRVVKEICYEVRMRLRHMECEE
jgi:hypothetical protein